MTIRTITDLAELVDLPDGTLLRWLAVPGDDTSTAVAFLRRTDHERGGDQGGITTSEVWISPGNGWEPEGVDVLVLPVEAYIADYAPGGLIESLPSIPMMSAPAWPQIESGTLLSGGTYPRDVALQAATTLLASAAVPGISPTDAGLLSDIVLNIASTFEGWLDRPGDPAGEELTEDVPADDISVRWGVGQ